MRLRSTSTHFETPVWHQSLICATALLVFAHVGTLAAFAQDRPATKKPFVQVPDTVSPQARQYLESLPDPATLLAWPAPIAIDGWKRANTASPSSVARCHWPSGATV